MKLHVTSNDTMQTIYEKAQSIERAFLDEHYKETGTVWNGVVGIEIIVPSNVWHDFMRMLPAYQQHEVMRNNTLMGLPVLKQ